jgi:hypothetical protein
MPFLIDGNNLIGAARGASRPSAEDRAALISEVADRLRRTRARAVLFFDGDAERSTGLGALAVRPSGRGSADDAIVEEIRKSRAPRECTVVTEDRALGSRARELGAQVISPSDFWARLGKRPADASPRTEERVDADEWLRYFSDEKNRDR